MEVRRGEEGMAVNGKTITNFLVQIVAGTRRLPGEDVGLKPADSEGRFVVIVHAKGPGGEETQGYFLSD